MSRGLLTLMHETTLPLLTEFTSVIEIPHTISFFIRKMRQIMSFDELPKPKRPPEAIWDNSVELETWFDRVFNRKTALNNPTDPGLIMEIDKKLIEG